MKTIKDFKVPALEKGLQILEALSAATDPMSLTDLCNELGRSPSELYRMIGFLEEQGYIQKEPHSGNYHLSLKLYELAHLHSPVNQMIKAAAIPMRELALAVKESCHLSVLQGGDLLVLYQQESPEKYRFSVEVGAKFNALHTVSGRLLLAYLSLEERTYYLNQDDSYKKKSKKEQASMQAEWEELALNGYAYSDQETHIGIRDIAVIVGNPKVGLGAALTIPSLIATRNPVDKGVLLTTLQQYANTITKGMGVSRL